MQEILSTVSSWHLKQAYHETLKEVFGHLEVTRRLDRAYKILTEASDYEILVHAGMPVRFQIISPNDTYTVTPTSQSCTCPDQEQLCKHRLAIRLIQKALAFQKEEKALRYV